MRSRDYWKRRMAQIAARQQRADEALEGRLRQGYEALRRGVDEDLAKFYARYAAGGGITMAEARKRLSKAELEGFRITLEEFRAKAIAGGYDRELNEIYLRSRVSRLQALQTQIDLRTRALFQDQRDLLHGHLAEDFSETYYRTVYELGKEFHIPASAAHLDAETVEQMISRPWLGEHFSSRVWINRDLLLRELGVTLSQGLVRGDSLECMSRLLAKRMQVSRARAETLVETESAHFAAEATLRGYRETGVDRYDFLASLDERTCEVCGPLDLKTFRTGEKETGANYPPMHPRCRCTTAPHFDDDFGEPGTRAARDSDGKTIQVPADMTYAQWRKQISEGVQEGDISDGARRAAKSLMSRKKVVGFDKLPESYQKAFRAGLAKAAPEARTVLRKHYRKADYILEQGKRSYYRGGFGANVVAVGADASPSTLAHELFHKLDRGGEISSMLMPSLTQDFIALNVVSGGTLKEYLVQMYPDAFVSHPITRKIRLEKNYRGIADIINGLTKGQLNLGYFHADEYWVSDGAVEAEAWAQFGRIQYENNPDVLKMLSGLFPNFEENAMIALKGLI